MTQNWLWMTLAACVLASCGSSGERTSVSAAGVHPTPRADSMHDEEDEGEEETVPVDQIPATVRTAATNALPGLVITSAERETEDGVVQYSIEGTVSGAKREVEVSADGSKVKIESGDDDDEGEEHDDN